MTTVVAPDEVVVDKASLLGQTFGGLTPDELAELAKLTTARRFSANAVLCHEGAFEDTFYIIASGEALVTKHVGDAEGERVLRRLSAGDYVGEMALIQNAPRAANVRTLTECVVLAMDKDDFETMLGRSPRLALSIIRSTLSRMRANDLVAIEDLQRNNRQLAQLDRNKQEFIEVAAHELRTPLTVMKGYLNVLKLDEAVRSQPRLGEVLEGLSRGTERLHEVVNAMLDASRVESAGHVSVAPVPVRSVVNDLVRRVLADAAGRQLTLAVEHAPDTPIIQADPTLLQKALYQVLINAVKYTPDGGRIMVRTRPVELDGGRAGVEISVADSGIGLDAEHHELIFEKFYQVGAVALHSSGKAAFKAGGPGLGLAIARGVVRAHGGRIWVESPGCDEQRLPGSTFYMRLPVKQG